MTSDSHPNGPIVVRMSGRTDVGRSREHNEDAFLLADLTTGRSSLDGDFGEHEAGSRGTLFMVADGLGGAVSGEIASRMAVEIVLEEVMRRWSEADSTDPASFAAALQTAAETANARIHEFAMANREHRGMGTTATIAGLYGDRLYLVQVGDSRAYLIRGGEARQLTKDQSLMQRLVEAGELTEEEAEQSERRNIILQALGPEPQVKIDLTHQQLRRGDALALCTDGLSGVVRKEEIARMVATEESLAEGCDRLIDLANQRGGPDNITVVLARFEGEGLLRASTGDPVGYASFNPNGETTREMKRRETTRLRTPSDVAPRQVPKLLRGNTPYLLAGIATVVIAVVIMLMRLGD
ncbi:MAG TPA: Stp1/IreP family PP2C-type Ser/Thr phosphatase [Gemmatimonadaceae bacterium]|nr:Stp1/IreP family PP2C-type Ser/Thr phosphatase [Gemmatimonadaceae bacterium]